MLKEMKALSADNSAGIKNVGMADGDMATTQLTEPVPAEAFDRITMVPAVDCYEPVLNSAGATYPYRDAIDARVVSETRNDTGFYINTEDEVGGYCTDYATREAGFDTDQDGIPNYWEDENGLNSQDASDGAIICEDGYSNLEHYLNALVEGVTESDYVAANPEIAIDLTDNTQITENESVTVNADTQAAQGRSIAKVEFYNGADLVGMDTEAPYTFTYTGLEDGTYSISARAYDSDGNETQSVPSRLHVNSTDGTGEWQSTDIGTTGIEGRL